MKRRADGRRERKVSWRMVHTGTLRELRGDRQDEQREGTNESTVCREREDVEEGGSL